MAVPPEEALSRFRRRTALTDESTLRRNLAAGVYGPPGSSSRTVAERVLTERFHETARALQIVQEPDTQALAARLDQSGRNARGALWLGVTAVLLGLIALASSLGWI